MANRLKGALDSQQPIKLTGLLDIEVSRGKRHGGSALIKDRVDEPMKLIPP